MHMNRTSIAGKLSFLDREGPPLPNDWRAPVMLRSNVDPAAEIVFDSAAKVAGNGRAV